MTNRAYYLTHPQVNVDADIEVQKWGLSDVGKSRVEAMLSSEPARAALSQVSRIVSSGETKAIETAHPIADLIGCKVEIVENMHENDRSATGFLPPDEFEHVADQFFAQPDVSIRGWETAKDAQDRILSEVIKCLTDDTLGDILFIGHGAVGTLLYCAFSGQDIDRKFDQGPQNGANNGSSGGGNFFTIDMQTRQALHHWRAMEEFGKH